MRTEEIIKYARDLRNTYATKNPFKIIEHFGFNVIINKTSSDCFKAHTIKFEGYPLMICINGNYSAVSQKILCAHELGHALLHNDGINHFAVTQKNIHTSVEYEANLFAVALLCDDQYFNMPINQMSNSTLKYILEYNIQK